MEVCNMDCFNCPYEDCINDEIDNFDRDQSNQHDTDVKRSRISGRKLTVFNYNHSEKGITARDRYEEKRKGIRKHSGTQISYEQRREYFKQYYLKRKQEQAMKDC